MDRINSVTRVKKLKKPKKSSTKILLVAMMLPKKRLTMMSCALIGQMKTLITRRAQTLAQSLATTRQAKQRPFQALKSLKKSALIKTISISSLTKPTLKGASSLLLQP